MKKPLVQTLAYLMPLPLFFWIGYALTHVYLPQPDCPPELYSTQTRDDLRTTFVQSIQEAKHSILLLIYSLTDQKIIQALRKKSEEGLTVQVICDHKASSGVSRKLGTNISTFYRKGRGLMHQKILVVDGKYVWIGSANMTYSSLKLHANLLIGLHSEELGALVAQKAKNMMTVGKVEKIKAQHISAGGQDTEMWFLPDNKDAVDRLIGLIQTAKKTLRVGMFTWTRNDLAQAIIEAKQRGVDAEVILDQHSGCGVSAKIADCLEKGNIPVHLSSGEALLHHKFMIIDGKILVNGSANWTKAAFTQNDDCFMVIHDLNKKQRQHLRRLWNVMKKESKKLGLIGYGKMGKMVEKIAHEEGHIITSIHQRGAFCLDNKIADKTDIFIDFSHPSVVLDHVEKVLSLGRPLVVGTTGWEAHIPTVKEWVAKSQTGLFYSPNFSIGMHLFQQIVAHASALMATIKDYDAAGMEVHHHQKTDTPSGTAKALIQTVSHQMKREPMPFSSLRYGTVPGTHTIFFDSADDTLTLTHQARNREGFARGALTAAQWLDGRKGFYTMGDMIQ